MKRIIAALLMLIMALPVPLAIADAAINSEYGMCGNKVHYKLTRKGEDYELRIYGKGKMWDFESYGNTAPWKGKNITKAVIEDGVTYVGAYSFFAMGFVGDSIDSVPGTKPTFKVKMADSITRIGEWAFAFTNMGSVTLPENLKKIDDAAFCGSDAKTVNFNDALEEIGMSAFSGVALRHLYLGNKVKSIGRDAFVDIEAHNVRLPESVKYIGAEAFTSCENLEYVYLYADDVVIEDYVDDEDGEIYPAFTRTNTKSRSKITIVARKGSTGAEYAERWNYKYAEMNPRKLVKKIKLSKTEVSIAKGRTKKITAAVKPDNAENKNLKWVSADKNIATVKNGVITAVGEGETIITVSAKDGSGVTAQVKVTVTPNVPKKISLNKTKATLREGKKLKLVATVKPAYAEDKTVTWTSSDPAIATVNKNGKVTAVATGTCTITATTVNGISVSCTIKVKPKK